MTRPLRPVDPGDPPAVLAALREALSGGPALFPGAAGVGLPAEVEQRIALVVETSGSTGRPKRVALSADALLASATAAESALGGPAQWLLALPANYIAGINVLTRAIASGTDPVYASAESAPFAEAAAAMDFPLRCTALVPVQLARLIESDALLEPLRRFDRILIGGQATPVELLTRALELGLNVTRTYGSAETSGGCVWDGVPLADTLVRVDEDDRIRLAGPTLAEGYLGDPERTSAAFEHLDGHRWYRTEDLGVLEAGVLRVTGRVDDVIVSGGVKVSLGEVEAVVRGLPGLADAVVLRAPSAWGESPVVVATVDVDLGGLRDAVAARLGDAARPERVVLVSSIPLTATGKPDRSALASRLGEQ